MAMTNRALPLRTVTQFITYMMPSMIPHAMLQPSAALSKCFASSREAIPAVSVAPSTMINQKRTSPSRLAGSKWRWVKLFLRWCLFTDISSCGVALRIHFRPVGLQAFVAGTKNMIWANCPEQAPFFQIPLPSQLNAGDGEDYPRLRQVLLQFLERLAGGKI